MRRTLPQCARLVAVLLLAAACNSRSAQSNHRHATVTVSATCSANQVTLTIDSSTVRFHHTNWLNPATDVEWRLDSNASVDSVTINPDTATQWPFDGAPPFAAHKTNAYTGKGKDKQVKGHYRYSLTVMCPNNGPTAIFDPDIWVD